MFFYSLDVAILSLKKRSLKKKEENSVGLLNMIL